MESCKNNLLSAFTDAIFLIEKKSNPDYNNQKQSETFANGIVDIIWNKFKNI